MTTQCKGDEIFRRRRHRIGPHWWVRVIEQLARPGVQHRGESELDTEAVFAQLEQRLRAALEEQIVEDPLIAAAKRAELRRQCEDNMEMRNRQDALSPPLQPVGLSEALTLEFQCSPKAHRIGAHWWVGQWRLRQEL